MPVPYSNMEDMIYCHNEELAEEIASFLCSKGYPVGVSGSQISTAIHGNRVVKRLDVFKKEKD